MEPWERKKISEVQEEYFSVRNPAELCRGPVGKKCYFSSFETAQRYINEELEKYRNRSLTMLFTPIETEIDGAQRALWGVYIDEAPQGNYGGRYAVESDLEGNW